MCAGRPRPEHPGQRHLAAARAAAGGEEDAGKAWTMSAHRCGTIGIVGRPNTGKSSLLNKLIGEKLSIVSPRAQTTRHLVSGILTQPDCQYIFVDSPGVPPQLKTVL